jgi:hypothetical protein
MKAIQAVALLECALIVACTEHPIPTAPTGGAELPTFSTNSGSSQTSVVQDAVGDVKNDTPAWLDIASASITGQGGRLLFTWDLAASVPADPATDPATPAHSDHVCLFDQLDTDPTTAPVGYPVGKNTAYFAEFDVALCWNPTGSFGLGTDFVGLLIDRRPLLSGGAAIVTPVEFRIDENHVAMAVDAIALGEPATFGWGAATEWANQADPNDAGKFPDAAPDAGLATWPQ